MMIKTSQELRMLSSFTINCQVTKIVMNSGSQWSELLSVSQMSQVSKIVFSIVKIRKIIVKIVNDKKSGLSELSTIVKIV